MAGSRDVLITGVGVVSPIGLGRSSFWASLQEGRSGVARLAAFPPDDMPVQIGAELKAFDPKQWVKPRKALKVMCRELQTAFSAYTLALEDAQLTPGSSHLAPERMAAVFGSEMLYGEVEDFIDLYQACNEDGQFVQTKFAEQFQSRMNPLWMLKNLPNMAACHVAIAHDAQGPCNTIVSGEVSSLLALIEAVRLIQRDHADLVLVGGTGTRVNLTGWMYRGDEHLSHRNDDPAAASRPFDADRDGMVNGEGAVVMILESREAATKRQASALGRIVATTQAMDTKRTAANRQAMLERLIGQTLASAQRHPADLGHINANGLSTIEDDRIEAAAIASVCGQIPVTAMKSYFGNTGATSSLMELAGSLFGLAAGEVPATLNYHRPDPQCPIRVVSDGPLLHRPASVLKLGLSTTGQAAAVLIDGDVDV